VTLKKAGTAAAFVLPSSTDFGQNIRNLCPRGRTVPGLGLVIEADAGLEPQLGHLSGAERPRGVGCP
jgi:hypothetical protein